jgi:hypothetical protein
MEAARNESESKGADLQHLLFLGAASFLELSQLLLFSIWGRIRDNINISNGVCGHGWRRCQTVEAAAIGMLFPPIRSQAQLMLITSGIA